MARGVAERGRAFQRGAGQSAAHLRVRLNHGASDITQSLRPSSAGLFVRASRSILVSLACLVCLFLLFRPTKRLSPSLTRRRKLSSFNDRPVLLLFFLSEISLRSSLARAKASVFVPLMVITRSLSSSSFESRWLLESFDSVPLLPRLRVDFPTISVPRSSTSPYHRPLATSALFE